jgi:predicted Fe-S protein YdhL (DUF1289 family)
MKALIAAVAAACLSVGAARAQTGPPPAPPSAPALAPPAGLRQAAPPDGTADIWSHMTGEQRRQLWQQLTPEERARIWQRLPPEQRRAIRERMSPEQRGAPPGAKLSPEERQRLRDQIRDVHLKRGGGRPGR